MIARELSALSTQSLIYSLGHDYSTTRAHNWPTHTLPLGTMVGDGDAAPAGIRALRAFAKAPTHMVRPPDIRVFSPAIRAICRHNFNQRQSSQSRLTTRPSLSPSVQHTDGVKRRTGRHVRARIPGTRGHVDIVREVLGASARCMRRDPRPARTKDARRHRHGRKRTRDAPHRRQDARASM